MNDPNVIELLIQIADNTDYITPLLIGIGIIISVWYLLWCWK